MPLTAIGDHPVEHDGTGVQEHRDREHDDQHHDEPETEQDPVGQRAVQDLRDEAEEMDAAKHDDEHVQSRRRLVGFSRDDYPGRNIGRHTDHEGHETEKPDGLGVLRQGEQRGAAVEGAHREDHADDHEHQEA